jgi:hypothetical protein
MIKLLAARGLIGSNMHIARTEILIWRVSFGLVVGSVDLCIDETIKQDMMNEEAAWQCPEADGENQDDAGPWLTVKSDLFQIGQWAIVCSFKMSTRVPRSVYTDIEFQATGGSVSLFHSLFIWEFLQIHNIPYNNMTSFEKERRQIDAAFAMPRAVESAGEPVYRRHWLLANKNRIRFYALPAQNGPWNCCSDALETK